MPPELLRVALALGLIGGAVALLLLRDLLRRRRAGKHCPQCRAAMDAEETVCPQCGHGLKPATAKAPPPVIHLPPLASPAERRRALQAKLPGGPRCSRPVPPAARRVAARALVLAAVVERAFLEQRPADLLTWLKRLGVAGELERPERALLKTSLGRTDANTLAGASWRREGLAVLAWALHRFELPAYDRAAEFAEVSVGLGDPESARLLLTAGTLRPADEIDLLATHLTVVGWRLQQFTLQPGPMDYAGYLRGHASFKEAWLDGLHFVDGDLALGSRPLAEAPADDVLICTRIATERRLAAYWLQGDHATYSWVVPSTILSAC
jgi:hypothetical protein